MVKLNRYYVNDQWKQIKIRNGVNMPMILDLDEYRAPVNALLPGESIMPDDEALPVTAGTLPASQPTINEELVPELVSMGFSEHGVRKALLATQSNDLEVTMNYILEHMEDTGFNDPIEIVPGVVQTNSTAVSVNMDSVAMLSSMGFTEDQATAALMSTGQDVER